MTSEYIGTPIPKTTCLWNVDVPERTHSTLFITLLLYPERDLLAMNFFHYKLLTFCVISNCNSCSATYVHMTKLLNYKMRNLWAAVEMGPPIPTSEWETLFSANGILFTSEHEHPNGQMYCRYNSRFERGPLFSWHPWDFCSNVMVSVPPPRFFCQYLPFTTFWAYVIQLASITNKV